MKIILLDGDYAHSLPIAEELVSELGAEIIGVGRGPRAHLARSRYTSWMEVAPSADADGYAARIIDLARTYGPSAIVPVGYHSFRAMLDARNDLPRTVQLLAPGAAAFEIASSKLETAELARRCGVRVPKQVGLVENGTVVFAPTRYPVFAKSSLERGGVSTALLQSEIGLQSFDWSTLGGDAVLQEVVDGDSFTYGHCGYFEDGDPVVEIQHVETRSVPRRGGAGSRLRTFEDDDLARAARSLLKALNWTGVAQVEFKKARDGGWVLMEINPKFWASYAHSSRAGAVIAASAVACLTGSKEYRGGGNRQIEDVEMVFPFRELLHVASERSPVEALRAVRDLLCPLARLNFRLRDLPANVPLPRRALRRKVLGEYS